MNAMTWYDHQTGSVWSQVWGQSIAGPLKGTTLDLIPASILPWASWKATHPRTLAMTNDKDGSDSHTHFVAPEHERTWIDYPKNVDKIVYALYALCVFLLVIDPFVHKHGPFAIIYIWGFYAFYGFIACVGLVIAAKWLRVIVMRPEDYYDH